jgi:hypothetical protein
MMERTDNWFAVLLCAAFLLSESVLAVSKETHRAVEQSDIQQSADMENADENESIWESRPIEVEDANVQILDKISGKVYKENIKVNHPKNFGSIELKLRRCFRNSVEDNREISAFIEIREMGKIIFANWCFASSPSVNLFSHSVYDVRVEF